MNLICNLCSYQEGDGHGGVQCGGASYSLNEGYGPFKKGAVCIYDDDLDDMFTMKTEQDNKVREMSYQLERQQETIAELRYKVSVLEDRLTQV